MRCFVALDLPTPVLDHVIEVSAPLRERYDIRWVKREQMHITLLFAGELVPASVDGLTNILENLELPSISLRLQSFGVFPRKGSPRVVWAGVVGDIERVRDLHHSLVERSRPLGVESEDRGYTPHLTLGRVRDRAALRGVRAELAKLDKELDSDPFAPTGLTLYRSTLTPTGPVYDVVTRRACG